MSNVNYYSNRFLETMPTESLIPGWDVPWIPNSTNSVPRYALDYSLSGVTQPIGFDIDTFNYLSQFKGFKHNAELKRLSFVVKKESVFRKTLGSTLFSTDQEIQKFRETILSKHASLNQLKEYVFEEGGLIDPIRTIADTTGKKKDEIKDGLKYGTYAAVGLGLFLLLRK
ncbi:hypothetical protein [Leptospira bandrabouensis]|uniref:hypothetical protein n=1 Tax=Leptospira bandrabouensis TaxID=2484903 RepID=UPI001EE91BC3|nr:hypothetical protein [Leptospira bandrabouensis]MCG6144113.1 hypothetical protein [Leptospira bandrabouensis]MCG6159774.1 hypothetical protein [Leptospira bandrabouensis]MCG6163707.1 hypothetical protein [Leptospira bandrabouensis]